MSIFLDIMELYQQKQRNNISVFGSNGDDLNLMYQRNLLAW